MSAPVIPPVQLCPVYAPILGALGLAASLVFTGTDLRQALVHHSGD